jgi:hypothetical protein
LTDWINLKFKKETIKYFYYLNNYFNLKEEKQKDNKEIRWIEQLLKDMYYKYWKKTKRNAYFISLI